MLRDLALGDQCLAALRPNWGKSIPRYYNPVR
jgi:hypothetical protein